MFQVPGSDLVGPKGKGIKTLSCPASNPQPICQSVSCLALPCLLAGHELARSLAWKSLRELYSGTVVTVECWGHFSLVSLLHFTTSVWGNVKRSLFVSPSGHPSKWIKTLPCPACSPRPICRSVFRLALACLLARHAYVSSRVCDSLWKFYGGTAVAF